MSLVGFPEFPVFISPADSLVLGWPAPRITPAGRHTLHSRSPPLPPAVTPTVSPGFTTHPQTHCKVCDASRSQHYDHRPKTMEMHLRKLRMLQTCKKYGAVLRAPEMLRRDT